MERFDLCVVGAGPGGYVAAIRAGQLGLKVVCVEKMPALGGTCLNIGCIPSKALLDSSEHYAHAKRGLAEHGVKVGDVTLDLPAMMTRKDKVVRGLTSGIRGLFKKYKVESVTGTGRLAGPDRVVVRTAEGEQTIETARVLIATGSEPTPLPSLPFDGTKVVSSTEALALARVPERLLVVGAGAVGLELGSVWRRLGAEVTVVEFLDTIVPAMDRGMAKLLQRSLERQGLAFKLETAARSAKASPRGLAVTLESRRETVEAEFDVVLVAIGRRPYTEGLGARELGVALDERGRITVNERYETSVAGVYAIGDCIPGPMLAHKAEEEGVAAAEMMAGRYGHVNYDVIPNVVYTAPELASVGLTEEDAAKRGLVTRIGTFPFMANARAKCLGETDGAVKVIADATTDRLLGVHVLGPRASDLVAEAAVAMEFGGSAEDLARTCHAHPTLAEAVKEAALGVAKRSVNV
jgi:dihydrolipoamide dehydrogenase